MLTDCKKLPCMLALLIAIFILALGLYLPDTANYLILAALAVAALIAFFWFRNCKPSLCQMLVVLATGSTLGTGILALAVLLGNPAVALLDVLLVAAVLAAVFLVLSLLMGCTRCDGCQDRISHTDPRG